MFKSKKEYTGHSGGLPGLVQITIGFDGRAIKVVIDDLVFDKKDKELVSELFVAALNDAYKKADEDLKKNLVDKFSSEYGQSSVQLYSLSDLLKPPGNGE